MRVIIAGSRYYDDYQIVEDAIVESGFSINEVVSGGARGVDTCATLWAKRNSIPSRVFHTKWKEYGLKAGPVRNAEMVAYADALVVIWDGHSSDSGDVKEKAKAANLMVYEKIIKVSFPTVRKRPVTAKH